MSYGMIANAETLYPGFRFVIWPLSGQDQGCSVLLKGGV
jgi:hypothetical protein